MNLIKSIEKRILSIFLLSFIFLRLPPLNLFLGKNISLINSQSLARYLVIFIFTFFIFKFYKKKLTINIDKKLIFFILLYFITISLSIITAINIPAFLEIYKHIAFGILFFFISLVVLDDKNKIKWSIYILALTMLINLIYQFIVYFYKDSMFTFQSLFYDKYWEVFWLNLERQRFFVDIYDSALIPIIFIFFYWFKNNLVNSFYKSLIVLVIIFFAAVSNFRTQLLMAGSSLVGTLYVINKDKNYFIIKLLSLFCILIMLSSVLRGFIGSSTIERITAPAEEETRTITGRFDWWQQSIGMGMSSPLVGIGLNNFYEYLSSKTAINIASFGLKNKLAQITATHPHSIFFQTFAETGLLGFISLMLLLLYFIIKDFNTFRKKNIPCSLVIVSFWSLFLFSVFNPPITLQYIILFWFLRALIIKSQKFYL